MMQLCADCGTIVCVRYSACDMSPAQRSGEKQLELESVAAALVVLPGVLSQAVGKW